MVLPALTAAALVMALVERLGGLTLLHITAAGNQPMIVQIEGSDATRPHDQIRLTVDPAACHLFDKSGQSVVVDFAETSYVKEVARARTFGFMQDVENMRASGLAMGGSLDNAVVMDEYRV